MLRPVLITPPAVDLLTLTEAKSHLRVDFTDDDTLIDALIDSAAASLDGYSGILGRCLINQVWRQDFDAFYRCLRLPFPDVTAAALTYYDSNNSQQTISSSDYQKLEDELGAYLALNFNFVPPVPYFYRQDAVSVTFTAGYGAAADDVPAPIKQAMLLLIGDWYGSRETMQEGRLAQLPYSVEALLTPYRRVGT